MLHEGVPKTDRIASKYLSTYPLKTLNTTVYCGQRNIEQG